MMINDLFSSSYILENVVIAVRPVCKDDTVKRLTELEGIEAYLCINEEININTFMCVKITNELVRELGLNLSVLWALAEKHTFAATITMSVGPMFGCKNSQMYVVTNNTKHRGASAFLNKSIIKAFAKMHQTDKVIVLPSSIHEVILLPYFDGVDMQSLDEMVREINEAQVALEEQLGNRAYILTA